MAKTALGAEERLKWSHHRNALDLVEHLRDESFTLVALECTAKATPIYRFKAEPPDSQPWVLVVGNERAGVDPGLLERCDLVLSLPMTGEKNSLNVAAAFRQRHTGYLLPDLQTTWGGIYFWKIKSMIETNGLTKTFKIKKSADITAVQDLTLSIPKGEVFGFLGPNGAGKTTTIRMLTSLIAPTAGTARINGFQVGVDDTEIRRSVGT